MPERPHDVPAAMRAAFEEHRVVAAWNMMALSDDENRMAALRGFERLLVARGLRLEDMTATVLAVPTGRNARRGRSAFERMVDDVVDEPTPAEPRRGRSATTPENLPLRSGEAIPAQIRGHVRIVEDDGVLDGERPVAMLTFSVVSQDAVYGPIVAYAGAYMNRLEEIVRQGRPVAMVVGQPHRGRRHPYLIRFTR